MRRTVELLALRDAIEKCASAGGMSKEASGGLLYTLGKLWQSGVDTAKDIGDKAVRLKDDVVEGAKRTGSGIYDFFAQTPEFLDRTDRKVEKLVDQNIVQPYNAVANKVRAAKNWYMHGVDITKRQLRDLKNVAYDSTFGALGRWWDRFGQDWRRGREAQNKNWED